MGRHSPESIRARHLQMVPGADENPCETTAPIWLSNDDDEWPVEPPLWLPDGWTHHDTVLQRIRRWVLG